MIFVKNFARNYERKILLGTSDVICPSKLGNQLITYIVDCRIQNIDRADYANIHRRPKFSRCLNFPI